MLSNSRHHWSACSDLPPRTVPAPPHLPKQAGDSLLLDVAPQFWTSPEVNSTFTDITRGGQVIRETLQGLGEPVSTTCKQAP